MLCDQVGFEPWLYHLQLTRPWTGNFLSLSLNFLPCKWRKSQSSSRWLIIIYNFSEHDICPFCPGTPGPRRMNSSLGEEKGDPVFRAGRRPDPHSARRRPEVKATEASRAANNPGLHSHAAKDSFNQNNYSRIFKYRLAFHSECIPQKEGFSIRNVNSQAPPRTQETETRRPGSVWTSPAGD